MFQGREGSRCFGAMEQKMNFILNVNYLINPLILMT